MPVCVTTSLLPENFSVIWHSSSAFGFEDGSVAFDRRDAAAFALVRHWTPRCFVFVNVRKFHLKTLFTERPNFEFAPFGFPCAVDLIGRDILITVRV